MADEVNVGTVKATLTADASEFTQAMGLASNSLLATGIASVALGKLTADLAESLLSAAKSAAQFAFDVTAAAGKSAESMQHMSQQTGIAVDEFERMAPILNRTGVSAEQITQGFRRLSQNIQAAQDPSSRAAYLFERMGISISGLETPSEVFQLITDRVAKMGPGFARNTDLVDLMGRAAMRLIPVMSQGTAGFMGFAEASAHAALILNTEAREALLKVDDSFDDLKTASDDLSKHLGVLFMPFVKGINEARLLATNWLTGFVDQVTIATRTLSERFTAFFSFLREAWKAKDLESIIELWKTIDATAAANIETIRQLGVTTTEAADAQEKLNAAAAKEHAGIVRLGEVQEQLGKKILVTNIAAQQLEATLLGTGMQQVAETLSAIFGTKVTTMEAAVEVQAGLEIVKQAQLDAATAVEAYGQKAFDAVQQVKQLTDVDITYADAVEQDRLGIQMRTEQIQKWNDSLTDSTALARRAAAEMAVIQATPVGPFAGVGAQRSAAVAAINAETEARKVAAEHDIANERQKQFALATIEKEGTARRMQMVQQFPTFWERQLRDVVSSNSFSVSQITTTWTSGIANSVVKGGQFFKQAWQSTEIAVVQGFLNFGIQMAAQAALQASVEMGILSAESAAKLGLRTATNAAVVASDTAAATASVSVWAGASAAIIGWYATVASGFAAISGALVGVVVAVGTFIEGVLGAIAAALTETVFGIPWAGAILVGIALIAAALAATGNLPGFAEGGIVTKPTLALIGESGPEAVVPLSGPNAGGGFGGGQQTIIIQLDRRTLTETVLRGMPREVRLRLGNAF